MLRTTLIALAATAGLAFAASSQAQAKTNINLDFGINLGGGSGGYVYVGDGYADDCHYVTVKHKKWNKWHTKKVVYYTKELVCY